MKLKFVALTGLFFISFTLAAECLNIDSCTDKNYNKCISIAQKGSETQKRIAEQFFFRCSVRNERSIEDYKKSLKWYQQAAKLGDRNSQHALGFMHEKGFGVKKNAIVAAQWYLKAAAQGYAPSQQVMAYFYRDGIGVNQDFVKSYMWAKVSEDYSIDKELLDWLSNKMTPQQIEKAQQRARERMKNHK